MSSFHFHVNVLALIDLLRSCSSVFCTDSLTSSVRDLATNLRWSYGIGIVLCLSRIARLELNYVIPMQVQKGDKWVDCVSCSSVLSMEFDLCSLDIAKFSFTFIIVCTPYRNIWWISSSYVIYFFFSFFINLCFGVMRIGVGPFHMRCRTLVVTVLSLYRSMVFFLFMSMYHASFFFTYRHTVLI